MAYVQRKVSFVGTPDTNPETKPYWDGCAAGAVVRRQASPQPCLCCAALTPADQAKPGDSRHEDRQR